MGDGERIFLSQNEFHRSNRGGVIGVHAIARGRGVVDERRSSTVVEGSERHIGDMGTSVQSQRTGFTRILLAQIDSRGIVAVVGVGGESGVCLERGAVIDTGEVTVRGEGHVCRGAGGQRLRVVLRHRSAVGQLVGYREVRSRRGTEVLDSDRHRLIVGEGIVLRHRSGDGRHTHIVLRHSGVDGNRGFRRLAGVVHLELRIDTITGKSKTACIGQRGVLGLRIDFLVAVNLCVRELRHRVDTHGGHTAGVTAIVLGINQQALSVEVVTAFDGESDPTDLVKCQLTVEHQSGVGSL